MHSKDQTLSLRSEIKLVKLLDLITVFANWIKVRYKPAKAASFLSHICPLYSEQRGWLIFVGQNFLIFFFFLSFFSYLYYISYFLIYVSIYYLYLIYSYLIFIAQNIIKYISNTPSDFLKAVTCLENLNECLNECRGFSV